MAAPLIAIVGDIDPGRTLQPASRSPQKAKDAAEQLGVELAKRGASLLIYGGPYLEADVVRGFVSANPGRDRSIQMRYSQGQVPPEFPEEKTHPKLFERREESGSNWKAAFYRSISSADGVILMGGDESTRICGFVSIGARIPILTLPEFGGGGCDVWGVLSAGEDLPVRNEITTMAKPWADGSAAECIGVLYSQISRRRTLQTKPKPALLIFAGILFLTALSIVSWIFGRNTLEVWMLFLTPTLAGCAGAAIRPVVDHVRGAETPPAAVLATLILGLVAGGAAGMLFVTAQLTADTQLALSGANLVDYARRSLPFAALVGFVAGLTSDAVFGKLLGLNVVRTTGIEAEAQRL